LAKFEKLSKQVQDATRQLESECNTFYGSKTVPAFVQQAVASQTAALLAAQAPKKQ